MKARISTHVFSFIGAGLGAKGGKPRANRIKEIKLFFHLSPKQSRGLWGGEEIKRELKSSLDVAIWCNLGTSEGNFRFRRYPC